MRCFEMLRRNSPKGAMAFAEAEISRLKYNQTSSLGFRV